MYDTKQSQATVDGHEQSYAAVPLKTEEANTPQPPPPEEKEAELL